MDKEIDQISAEKNLSTETRESFKLRFTEIPNRTYLWLYLMLEELRTCLGSSEKKLLRVIDRLPISVEQSYEQILQRCNEKNERHAKDLLEIIVAARRPLTLGKLISFWSFIRV
ncbi:uncharacterized protein N7483_008007 [Penicillium malachiteum]|uniref:uncharacterized protein n=1 Tax=Penicillium malachiteum TaxID=1324776 RepID=UPI002546A4F5|nr:uncharacterized protein N7483_008007 [Penicillium malachiteum]KAJ5726650.1 hypothetical protein N7483_008007 [Penicillium malachiteum]